LQIKHAVTEAEIQKLKTKVRINIWFIHAVFFLSCKIRSEDVALCGWRSQRPY